MDVVRKIIDANQLSSIVDLPGSMKNKKVEVIVLPTVENAGGKSPSKSVKGALRKYANPELIAREKGAWKDAAVKKHGYT